MAPTKGADIPEPALPPQTSSLELGPLAPTLYHRPIVHNKDGSVSTTLSFSKSDNTRPEDAGYEVLVPQVVGGKVLTQAQAWEHYKQTGEYIARTKAVDANISMLDKWAIELHNRQDKYVQSGGR